MFVENVQEMVMREAFTWFPGVEVVERPSRTGNPERTARFIKERRASQKRLSESCALLRQIRTDLGMSQESFADALGIPTATLLSYEYGRTSAVKNHELIRKAKRLYEERKSISQRSSILMAKSMTEIVIKWARDLGVCGSNKREAARAVANALGVSYSTVYRWISGNMRPRPIKLIEYDDQIAALASQKAKGEA